MKNWAVYLAAVAGFAIYGASTTADRDESGAIVGEGSVDAFSLRVGDCFNSASSDTEVSSVPGVPCSDLHDYETYAVFDVNLDEYPGDDAILDLAFESCMDRFTAYVGAEYESSTLDVTAMYPSPESWRQDDREVLCAVYDMNGEQLVGSTKGSGI